MVVAQATSALVTIPLVSILWATAFLFSLLQGDN